MSFLLLNRMSPALRRFVQHRLRRIYGHGVIDGSFGRFEGIRFIHVKQGKPAARRIRTDFAYTSYKHIKRRSERSPGGYRTFRHYKAVTQAERIIECFGGVRPLMRALKAARYPRNAASIYKWTYPWPRGAGGLIPEPALYEIKFVANKVGVRIPKEALEPTKRLEDDSPKPWRKK